MSRKIALLAAILLATACAAPSSRPPAVPAAELLSGAALFGREPPLDIVPAEEIVALDDEMRAFVAENVPRGRDTGRRLARLLAAMRERGLFDLYYADERTRTPRETFYDARGNCLSFTMLFVALAREAGLDVSYQMVEIPPAWNSDAQLAILTQHINALVETAGRAAYTVDFNETEYKGDHATREVGDDYALALYYSNRGVEHMVDGRYEASLGHLAHAIRIYPELAGPWSNLGVLYSRHGLREHAEAAYLHALRNDPHDNTALANLASLYRVTGRSALAEEYERRVRRHRQRNPYYHYARAREAFEDDRPREALDALGNALRLKKDDHRFHYLKGLAHLRVGDAAAARASFARARSYSSGGGIGRRYDGRIAESGADL